MQWACAEARRPRICGILNLTDDSFSCDGPRGDAEDAVAQGVAMVGAGADMLDVVPEFLHRAHAQPDALVPAERMRFDAVMPTVFRHWDNLYCQFRSGTLDREMWGICERTLTRWLAQESWANWFLDNADSCSDSLRALLRGRLAGRDTAGWG